MSNLTDYNGVQIVLPDPVDEGGQALNSNFKALSTHIDTIDPTASNDSTQGYSYGSRWYNSNTSDEWICVDPTQDHASWQNISLLGPQGPQGVQGAQGFQGWIGAQGSMGTQGWQGTQGAQGMQGMQGGQGGQGAQGSIGAQGWQGAQGAQGMQGWQGGQGFQGSMGAQGVQGAQGMMGSQGWQGSQGSVGNQGAQGAQGSQGSMGAQGPMGGMGSQGAQGSQGSMGAQGSQGAQGAQGSQGLANNSICDGRLTAASGSPIPIGGVTGATSIYFTPCEGNTISLYSSGAWSALTFTEIQLYLTTTGSSGGANLTANTNYDIFAYNGSGSVTLDPAYAWRNSGQAITGATNASPIAITASGHGVQTNDTVFISGVQGNTAANGIWLATQIDANTFSLQGSTGNGTYTSSTGYLNARVGGAVSTYGLSSQDGVLVKPGDSTRRLLGTVRTTNTAGQTEWSNTKVFVSNIVNRRPHGVLQNSLPSSWSDSTGASTFHYANSDSTQIVEAVFSDPTSVVDLFCVLLWNGSDQGSVIIGQDGAMNNGPGLIGSAPGIGSALPIFAKYASEMDTAGYHFFMILMSNVGTGTVYGGPNRGLTGVIDS